MTPELSDLFANFSILVALTFLVSLLLGVRQAAGLRAGRLVLIWAGAALSGIILMQYGVRLGGGVLVDFRSVAPAMVGLYGGLTWSLPVAVPIAAYRYFVMGGGGAVAGTVNILVAALVSGLLRTTGSEFRKPLRLAWRGLVILAVANISFLFISWSFFRQYWVLITLVHTAGFVAGTLVLGARLQALQNIREVTALAHTDHLTGLPNVRSFEIAFSSHPADRPGGLLLLDLDHFKEINDTFGHLVGDEALRGVAQTIRQQVRDQDVVCRYGGEEFAVLLWQCSPQQAGQVSERIRQAVSEYRLTLPGQPSPKITVSGGLVPLSPGISMKDQFSAADALLYKAKANGRNRICAGECASTDAAEG